MLTWSVSERALRKSIYYNSTNLSAKGMPRSTSVRVLEYTILLWKGLCKQACDAIRNRLQRGHVEDDMVNLPHHENSPSSHIATLSALHSRAIWKHFEFISTRKLNLRVLLRYLIWRFLPSIEVASSSKARGDVAYKDIQLRWQCLLCKQDEETSFLCIKLDSLSSSKQLLWTISVSQV